MNLVDTFLDKQISSFRTELTDLARALGTNVYGLPLQLRRAFGGMPNLGIFLRRKLGFVADSRPSEEGRTAWTQYAGEAFRAMREQEKSVVAPAQPEPASATDPTRSLSQPVTPLAPAELTQKSQPKPVRAKRIKSPEERKRQLGNKTRAKLESLSEQLKGVDSERLSALTLRQATQLLAWVTDMVNVHAVSPLANPHLPDVQFTPRQKGWDAVRVRESLGVEALMDPEVLGAVRARKQIHVQSAPGANAAQTSPEALASDLPAWQLRMVQLHSQLVQQITEAQRAAHEKSRVAQEAKAREDKTKTQVLKRVEALIQALGRQRVAHTYELGYTEATWGLNVLNEALSAHYGAAQANPYPYVNTRIDSGQHVRWRFQDMLNLGRNFDRDLLVFLKRIQEDAQTVSQLAQKVLQQPISDPVALIENLRTNLLIHLNRLRPDPQGPEQWVELKKLRHARQTIVSPRAVAEPVRLSEYNLSPIELKVLAHLAAGRTSEQIAHLLGASAPETVLGHESRVRKKLGIQGADTVGELLWRYPIPDKGASQGVANPRQLGTDLEVLLGRQAMQEITDPLVHLRNALQAMGVPVGERVGVDSAQWIPLESMPMWLWMQQAQAHRPQAPGVPMLSQNELMAAGLSLGPEARNVLRHWVVHPTDSAALGQATGYGTSSVTRYKAQLRDAFGVTSLSELDQRVPGGLQALLAFVEWQHHLAWQPQAILELTPGRAPDAAVSLVFGASGGEKKGGKNKPGTDANTHAKQNSWLQMFGSAPDVAAVDPKATAATTTPTTEIRRPRGTKKTTAAESLKDRFAQVLFLQDIRLMSEAAALAQGVPAPQVWRQFDSSRGALAGSLGNWYLRVDGPTQPRRYSDAMQRIPALVQPLVAPAESAAQFLERVAADPGQWLIDNSYITATHPQQLNALSFEETELLDSLLRNKLNVRRAHNEALNEGERDGYNVFCRRVAALREKINPSTPTLRALGYSYPGGAKQLKADVTENLLLLQSEHSKAEVPGRVVPADVWKQSVESNKEILITKEARTQSEGGHATLSREGNDHAVGAKIVPSDLIWAVHTHIEGPTKPEERQPSAHDAQAVAQLNDGGALAPELSIQYGPRGHHRSFIPRGAARVLSLNAQAVNLLEQTRQHITQAVQTTPEESILELSTRAHLKRVQGTAVLRFDGLQEHQWGQAIGEALQWASRQNGVHTLRVEAPGVAPDTLRKVAEQSQAHYTREDAYDFETGQYNLMQELGVISIALREPRATLDQRAHALTGVDRAYAYQTLALLGTNKTYEVEGAVDLGKFLTLTDRVDVPNVQGPAVHSVDLIFHVPEDKPDASAERELQELKTSLKSVAEATDFSDLQKVLKYLSDVRKLEGKGIARSTAADQVLKYVFDDDREVIKRIAGELDASAQRLPALLGTMFSVNEVDGLLHAVEFIAQLLQERQQALTQKAATRPTRDELNAQLYALLLTDGTESLKLAHRFMAQAAPAVWKFSAEQLAQQAGLNNAQGVIESLQQLARTLNSKMTPPSDRAELGAYLRELLQLAANKNESPVDFVSRLFRYPRNWAISNEFLVPVAVDEIVRRLVPAQIKLLQQFSDVNFDEAQVATRTGQSLTQVQDSGQALLGALGYRSWSEVRLAYPQGLPDMTAQIQENQRLAQQFEQRRLESELKAARQIAKQEEQEARKQAAADKKLATQRRREEKQQQRKSEAEEGKLLRLIERPSPPPGRNLDSQLEIKYQSRPVRVASPKEQRDSKLLQLQQDRLSTLAQQLASIDFEQGGLKQVDVDVLRYRLGVLLHAHAPQLMELAPEPLEVTPRVYRESALRVGRRWRLRWLFDNQLTHAAAKVQAEPMGQWASTLKAVHEVLGKLPMSVDTARRSHSAQELAQFEQQIKALVDVGALGGVELTLGEVTLLRHWLARVVNAHGASFALEVPALTSAHTTAIYSTSVRRKLNLEWLFDKTATEPSVDRDMGPAPSWVYTFADWYERLGEHVPALTRTTERVQAEQRSLQLATFAQDLVARPTVQRAALSLEESVLLLDWTTRVLNAHAVKEAINPFPQALFNGMSAPLRKPIRQKLGVEQLFDAQLAAAGGNAQAPWVPALASLHQELIEQASGQLKAGASLGAGHREEALAQFGRQLQARPRVEQASLTDIEAQDLLRWVDLVLQAQSVGRDASFAANLVSPGYAAARINALRKKLNVDLLYDRPLTQQRVLGADSATWMSALQELRAELQSHLRDLQNAQVAREVQAAQAPQTLIDHLNALHPADLYVLSADQALFLRAWVSEVIHVQKRLPGSSPDAVDQATSVAKTTRYRVRQALGLPQLFAPALTQPRSADSAESSWLPVFERLDLDLQRHIKRPPYVHERVTAAHQRLAEVGALQASAQEKGDPFVAGRLSYDPMGTQPRLARLSHYGLTQRQVEVLKGLVQGMSHEALAQQMNVAQKQVRETEAAARKVLGLTHLDTAGELISRYPDEEVQGKNPEDSNPQAPHYVMYGHTLWSDLEQWQPQAAGAKGRVQRAAAQVVMAPDSMVATAAAQLAPAAGLHALSPMSADPALQIRAAKRLMSITDLEVEMLFMYVQAERNLTEIADALGVGKQQVRTFITDLPRTVTPGGKRSEIPAMLQSLTAPGQSVVDFVYALKQDRQAWVDAQAYAPKLTEADLDRLARDLRSGIFAVLEAMAIHGNNDTALMQAAGLSKGALSKYRSRLYAHFDVNTIEELGLRSPGGLKGLVEALEQRGVTPTSAAP